MISALHLATTWQYIRLLRKNQRYLPFARCPRSLHGAIVHAALGIGTLHLVDPAKVPSDSSVFYFDVPLFPAPSGRAGGLTSKASAPQSSGSSTSITADIMDDMLD